MNTKEKLEELECRIKSIEEFMKSLGLIIENKNGDTRE